MSAAQTPSSPTPSPTVRSAASLRVSVYDQVSSLLISLLMLIGFCVTIMFLIWLTSQVWVQTTVAVPISLVEEEPGGGGDGSPNTEELEEPNQEEIEVIDPPVEITLENITDVVSTQVVNLDAFKPKPSGAGPGRGKGRGTGTGDGTADIIPRWERWDIRYATNSIEAYARQLDTFQIELGAVGGGANSIDYAIGFAGGSPKKRSGPAADEKRLYFTWKQGSLMEADQTLLSQAGINTKGRIMMQFYSKEIEDQLALIEKQYSGNRDTRSIRRTVFGVRPKGSGLEYYVIEQAYRTFQE